MGQGEKVNCRGHVDGRRGYWCGWNAKTDALFASLYFGFLMYTVRGLGPRKPRLILLLRKGSANTTMGPGKQEGRMDQTVGG